MKKLISQRKCFPQKNSEKNYRTKKLSEKNIKKIFKQKIFALKSSGKNKIFYKKKVQK